MGEGMTARAYDYRDLKELWQHNDGSPHRADASTVVVADTYHQFHGGNVTFDVWCMDCGLSGSFSIDIAPESEDVQWE